MYEIVLCCYYPNCIFPAYKNRQMTAYAEDELNFANLCPYHQKEADEYWQERWDEYHSSIL